MQLSFNEIKQQLASGELTAVSLTQAYLQEIEKNKDLNAFIEVFETEVLEQAKEVDVKLQAGTAGRLAGCVIALKDNIVYKGHKVTASSKILTGFESLFTATALQRLLDEDAIVIGRTACDEFAMGSSNETSVYGPVKNGMGENLVPGGSSGGSAVAVQMGMCTVALGSDTGGSIRQPASFTGIVGMKPSYGRISRYGLIAYGSSFDQIGPMTRTVADSELLYQVMAGRDDMDATSSSQEVNSEVAENTFEGKKVALLSDAVNREGIDAEVKERLLSTADALRAQGAEVSDEEFGLIDYMVPTYYVLSTAEASSNLSRFDGVHYGYRADDAEGVENVYTKSRSEGFGPEVQRRIMTGTFVLSAGYYDAYYSKGQKVRRLVQKRTEELLEKYDAILLPTTPSTAFGIGADKDPISMYLEDIFTVQANLAGIPAISVPVGRHSNGLPFGVQLMTAKFAEDKLFGLSKEIEKLKG